MLHLEKKSKILLVDDLPENLLALESVLQDLDCQLFKAGSGHEALRLARKHSFALVLLDVQMPGMDGFETASFLRSTKKTEHIPIIFVTALSYEQKYVFRGYETGAVDYLFKPIEPAILRSKVKVFLTLYHNTLLLAQQKQELEEEISRRRQAEEELQGAKEAAEAANQAKSIFLANMSHELRTPLNAILGFTQLMARSSHTPEQQEHLDIILRNGEHLLTLINQVLDLSKIEAGRITLEEKNFNLRRMLKELYSIFSFKAQKKGLQLFFEYDDTLPEKLYADEVKLRQILINLLSNAVKFTQEGRVSLEVTKVPEVPKVSEVPKVPKVPKVEELPSWEGAGAGSQAAIGNPNKPASNVTLRFSIEDSGPGIAPEEMQGLFEPFVQTDIGRQAREGTGLGLSISRKFVQLMGGGIRVESRPGHGAGFHFDIQVGLLEHSTPVPQESGSMKRVIALAPGQPRYRLLIADDTPDNRKILISLFEPLGFELREAQNGQEVLEIWKQWQPHLIWMDLRMPTMDGLESIKRIRELSPRPPAMIALSASMLDDDRSAVPGAGYDEFLRKPFREQEIFDILQRHLNVQFVYEERTEQQAKEAVIPEMLSSLPKELYQKLQREVVVADFVKALALVEEVRQQNEELADGLAELIKAYRFDRLQDLFEKSPGEA